MPLPYKFLILNIQWGGKKKKKSRYFKCVPVNTTSCHVDLNRGILNFTHAVVRLSLINVNENNNKT